MVIRKLCMTSALAIFAASAITGSLALKYREDAVVANGKEYIVGSNKTGIQNDELVGRNTNDENILNVLAIDAKSIVRSGIDIQLALSIVNSIVKEFSSISSKNQKAISKFTEHTKKDLIALLKARRSELKNEIKSLDSAKTGRNVAEINVALQKELNRTDEIIGLIKNNKTESSRALLAYFSLYLAELRNSITLQDSIESAKDIVFYSKNTKLSEKALATMNASNIVDIDRFIKKFMKKGYAVFKDKAFKNEEVKDRLDKYLNNEHPNGILQSAISSELIKNLVIDCVYTNDYDGLTKEKQNAIPRKSTLLAENIILSLNKKSAKQKLTEFFSRDKQNSPQDNNIRKRDRIKRFFSENSKNVDQQAIAVRQGKDSIEALEQDNVHVIDLESQKRVTGHPEEHKAIEWVTQRGNVKSKRATWENIGMIENKNNTNTYYDILGVSQDASASEISKAYRKLAQQYHPDKTGGNKDKEQKLQAISEAYNTLKDPVKRSAYDRELEYEQFENKYRH